MESASWSSYRDLRTMLISWGAEDDKTDQGTCRLEKCFRGDFGFRVQKKHVSSLSQGDQRHLNHAWNQDLLDHESCEMEPNGKELSYIIHISDCCNSSTASNTRQNPQLSLRAILTKAKAYLMTNRQPHLKSVREAKLKCSYYRKPIELDKVDTSALKNATNLRAWATGVSSAYNSINTLDLDLIFPIEQTYESNTAPSQYKLQRALPGLRHQTQLLQAHGRLETLLVPSAPMFVTSCATYYGATILLHHFHSRDSYQNLFMTLGALCGLFYDLHSENWVLVGRSVPMCITIAMILSIVYHGFFQTFPDLRGVKAIYIYGNQETIGGTANGVEEKHYWAQENA